jgi:hypothetical protein
VATTLRSVRSESAAADLDHQPLEGIEPSVHRIEAAVHAIGEETEILVEAVDVAREVVKALVGPR